MESVRFYVVWEKGGGGKFTSSNAPFRAQICAILVLALRGDPDGILKGLIKDCHGGCVRRRTGEPAGDLYTGLPARRTSVGEPRFPGAYTRRQTTELSNLFIKVIWTLQERRFRYILVNLRHHWL